MIASVRMPSASPSKFMIMRWRSAGAATWRMSSIETARRRAVAHELLRHPRRLGVLRVGREHDAHRVVLDLAGERHLADQLAHLHDPRLLDHGLGLRDLCLLYTSDAADER